MNDDFWRLLARHAEVRKPEAYWAAQRRRVLARLHGPARSKLWLPVPALAAAALIVGLVVWRHNVKPAVEPQTMVPPAQWEFLESTEMLDNLDVLMKAKQLDHL